MGQKSGGCSNNAELKCLFCWKRGAAQKQTYLCSLPPDTPSKNSPHYTNGRRCSYSTLQWYLQKQAVLTHSYPTISMQVSSTSLLGAGSRIMLHCISDGGQEGQDTGGKEGSGASRTTVVLHFLIQPPWSSVEEGRGCTQTPSTQTGARSPITWC